mgnify:CR=1 FL=1
MIEILLNNIYRIDEDSLQEYGTWRDADGNMTSETELIHFFGLLKKKKKMMITKFIERKLNGHLE